MTGTKFTNPPWRVVEDGDFVVIRAEGNIGYAVANGFTDEQRRANATLMAAAPDLYLTLLDLVNEFDLHGDDLDQWVMAERIRSARAALAKAKGA